MYLIHAEAAVRGRGDLNAAISDIQALEARAHGTAPSAITIQAGSADALLLLIETERKKELCYEGHRFFDMMRMECQYNEAIEQNEGYDDYKTGGPMNGTDSEEENAS